MIQNRITVIIITIVALALWLPMSAAAEKCHYCNGTGKRVVHNGTGTYGHSNDRKVKCPECGEIHWASTGHSHIHCQYCGGTGERRSSTGSAHGSASERLNEIARENPEAFTTAMTLKYGLSMYDTEYRMISTMSPRIAAVYKRYRNYVDGAVIHCNQSIAMQWYRNMSPSSAEAYLKSQVDEAIKCTDQINNLLSQGEYCDTNALNATWQRHFNILKQTGDTYLNACATFHQLNNLQNQIDNMILFQNLF